MKPPPDIELDETFQRRFRLERVLGRGGMGAVWLAQEIPLRRMVAIKFLQRKLAESDGDAVVRFGVEGRVTAALRHPNIVQIFDCGVSGPYTYLVYEFVDGSSLQKIMDEAKDSLSPAWVAAVGVAISEALDHAHGQGIIHRDIKPDNILVAREGPRANLETDDLASIKVTDFGIAKAPSEISDVRTKTGIVLGTPLYMSPEQCRGERLDARSDVYALGAVLYHLLAGKAPFEGAPMDVLMGHLKGVIPDLADEAPMVAPALVEVVHRALIRNREGRFAGAALLGQALRQAMKHPTREAAPLPRTRARSASAVIEKTAIHAAAEAAPRASETKAHPELRDSQRISGRRIPFVAKLPPPSPKGRRKKLIAMGISVLLVGLVLWRVSLRDVPPLLRGDVTCSFDPDRAVMHLRWNSEAIYVGEAEFLGSERKERLPSRKHALELPWKGGGTWRSATLRLGSDDARMDAPVLRMEKATGLSVLPDGHLAWHLGRGMPGGSVAVERTREGGMREHRLESAGGIQSMPVEGSDLLRSVLVTELRLPPKPLGSERSPSRLRLHEILLSRRNLSDDLFACWSEFDAQLGFSDFATKLNRFNGQSLEVLPQRGDCRIRWAHRQAPVARRFLKILLSALAEAPNDEIEVKIIWDWLKRLHPFRQTLVCASRHWNPRRIKKSAILEAAEAWLALLPDLERAFLRHLDQTVSCPPQALPRSAPLARITFPMANAFLAPDNTTWSRDNFGDSIFRPTYTALGMSGSKGKEQSQNSYEAFVDCPYNLLTLSSSLGPIADKEGLLAGLPPLGRQRRLDEAAATVMQRRARQRRADTSTSSRLVDLAEKQFEIVRPRLALFLSDAPRKQVFEWTVPAPGKVSRHLRIAMDVQGLRPESYYLVELNDRLPVALFTGDRNDEIDVRHDPQRWEARVRADPNFRPEEPPPSALHRLSFHVPTELLEGGKNLLRLRMLRLTVSSVLVGLDFTRVLSIEVREETR